MTFATYTWAGPAGPGRGGTRDRSGPTLWVVLHTSEGGEGPTNAENLASFIRSPSSPGNVASYHLITDTDRVLRIMDDTKRSHGGAGANDQGLHICFPGRASQTKEQWLDSVSAAYIEQAARATADWCVKWKIPPSMVFAVGMKKNQKGITDHNQVRLAFGQTTHTDVGPNFPWEHFMNRVLRLVSPPPPPPPSTRKGQSVFIMRYANKHSYLVQANLDKTFTKTEVTGLQQYLHLIGAGLIPFEDNADGVWNSWLESIPEV